MELQNKKIGEDKFHTVQADVLNQWPTGRQVDFSDTVRYQASLPEQKQYAKLLSQAHFKKQPLIQARVGTPGVEHQIELLSMLQLQGRANLLCTAVDNYTCQNRYKEAEKELLEAVEATQATLSCGFPIVNHGVYGCRQVINAAKAPVQACHNAADARLLAEIAFAGGFTSLEGGGISCNIPYAKSASLERTLLDWQYVDRLTGLYEEAGTPLNREPYGPLTGTLVPPCISHAVAVIECLMAAEQGVKHITVGYGQGGNLVQDIAALQALHDLAYSYLDACGYSGVQVNTTFYQWMGGLPQDEARAFSIIAWASTAAALTQATKVVVRSPQEGLGVPSWESYAQGLRCTKQTLSLLGEQQINSEQISREKAIICAETRCIVDKCFELGEGDIGVGVIRGFEAGVIDIPFAPSRFNAGKMLPARDNEGAVRILDAGALPLSRDLLDNNRGKIEERAKKEKRAASYQMVIDDVYAIGKGDLLNTPV